MCDPMASAPLPSPARPFPLGERELIALLALMQALQALAIDAMLPALGHISADLGVTDPNHRQFVVGLFLGGIALGALIPGPLADRYGRRPVLMVSLGLYVLTSAACAIVTEFNTMLILRVLGGAASAALAVVPPALIRDRFSGDRMARLQSMIAVIFLTVPMLAPTIGQGIELVAGWRAIFWFMALAGLAITAWMGLRLPETLDPAHRQTVRFRIVGTNMRTVLSERGAFGYIFGSACTTGALWGWIQCCEQLLGEHFAAGTAFPFYFGGMALIMASGNFANARIVERFGARRVGHTALFCYIAVSALQVWLAFSPHQTLWRFVPVMATNMLLMGFITANFASIAIQPFARIAGAASSVQAFIRIALGSVVGAIVGQSYDQTARPLAFALLLAGLTSLALVLWSERGHLFRRMIPPGAPRPA